MLQRNLGRTGLQVSAIGYGAMGISQDYADADERVATIRRAFDLGVTFFDTAELYGWGESERMVGTAVAPFRDEVVIATKFGFTPDGGLNSRPDHILQVVENSLRHLQTDHIDLLFQHRPDPEVPIQDVAGTVKGLIDKGVVRHFGLSEVGPATVLAAHAIQPVAALETEYSLFEREVERLFGVLDDLGIGLVPYSPLGRGFLTGTARPAATYDETDIRRSDPRWQPGNFERNLAAVAGLSEIAEHRGVTVGQLALAWLLTRRPDLCPIPGTRNIARLEQNVAAADLELGGADLARIGSLLPHGAFGARYADDQLPTWV